jgi:glycolate oxidase
MILDWGEIASRLEGIVGGDNITVDPVDLLVYSYDASLERGRPNAVVFPTSPEQISQIVKLANQEGFPVIPRGGGSNVSGGVLAIKGGVVVSLTRMRRILEVDEKNFQVLVEAGVVCADLNMTMARYGLFFPPDPASDKACTMGGMICENSGGIRAVKYGVTKNWVNGLEVVLPNGEILWTGGKSRKNVSGYDLKSLFIGSEGTLGIVTKALLNLQPLPETRLVASAYFKTSEEAGNCVYVIMRRRFDPSGAEILDRATLKAVEEYSGLRFPECGAAVLVELDGDREDVERRLKRLSQIFQESGAIESRIAEDEAEGAQIWMARKAAFPALTLRRPTARMEDVSVPLSNLARMFEEIGRVSREHGVEIATFGHAGDGNLHPILLWDERDKEEHDRAMAALKALWRSALKLGGTVTGEHGIGVSKLEMMGEEHGRSELWAMRAVKEALDRNNIMNPGKAIP